MAAPASPRNPRLAAVAFLNGAFLPPSVRSPGASIEADPPVRIEPLLQEGVWPDLRADDRRLAHELVLGVLRSRSWLDALLDRFSRRPVRFLPLPVRSLLRVAAYQILRLDRVPSYAAVHQAVDSCRLLGFPRQAGYVNAVLRKISALDAAAACREPEGGSAAALAVRLSHPPFLVERWLERHGTAAVRGWLERSNQVPDTFVVVREACLTVEAFLEEARLLGAEAERWSPEAPIVRVRRGGALLAPLLDRGAGHIQDVWSWAVAAALPAGPYRRILDLCAAPGGKSFVLARRFPEAVLVSADRSAGRLSVLRRRAGPLGDAGLAVAAEAVAPPFPPASFDLVLVDAPCSGTGTLARNPDLRWRLAEPDILRLARAQREILCSAARLVAPGGCLAYATCSTEPEENESVVSDFLRRTPGFRPRPLAADGPWSPYVDEDGHLRTFPHAPCGEGFFLAVLERGHSCDPLPRPIDP